MLSDDDPNGHVNYLTFGLDKLHDREPLHRLITNTRRMDSSTALLALREMYETQYGIFNHDEEGITRQAPMALAAMHRKEDPYTYSLERRYLWRFRRYKIQEKWGLSLKEWLELPFYMADDLLTIEQRIAAEEMKRLKEQEAEEDRRRREGEARAGSMRYGPAGR